VPDLIGQDFEGLLDILDHSEMYRFAVGRIISLKIEKMRFERCTLAARGVLVFENYCCSETQGTWIMCVFSMKQAQQENNLG
jgi:hypothetical protein